MRKVALLGLVGMLTLAFVTDASALVLGGGGSKKHDSGYGTPPPSYNQPPKKKSSGKSSKKGCFEYCSTEQKHYYDDYGNPYYGQTLCVCMFPKDYYPKTYGEIKKNMVYLEPGSHGKSKYVKKGYYTCYMGYATDTVGWSSYGYVSHDDFHSWTQDHRDYHMEGYNIKVYCDHDGFHDGYGDNGGYGGGGSSR